MKSTLSPALSRRAASRQETREQSSALELALREGLRERQWNSGQALPTVRELAKQYDVSTSMAYRVVKRLADEGLICIERNSGIYAGSLASSQRPVFAFATHSQDELEPNDFLLRRGFETRIAELGGAVVALTREDNRIERLRQLPNLAGVFESTFRVTSDLECPRVIYMDPVLAQQKHESGEIAFDSVSMDNEDGARLAVKHLCDEGHKTIAFLGVHHPQHLESAPWSRERENGWREALEEAGFTTQSLSFLPPSSSQCEIWDYHCLANETVGAVCNALENRPITAVIAANDMAALALVEELKNRRLPRRVWPSIVGFDNDPRAIRALITSLTLPWDEIGRTAAQLLWERSRGDLPPAPQHRKVKMMLIPRLTCRSQWSLMGV